MTRSCAAIANVSDRDSLCQYARIATHNLDKTVYARVEVEPNWRLFESRRTRVSIVVRNPLD